MVNIEQLSAKELYELAKKKEQEEAKLAEMQENLKKLESEREELIKRHKEELAETNRQIDELTSQRDRMVEGHEKALSMLEQKLKAHRDEVSKAASAPTPEKAPAKPEAPAKETAEAGREKAEPATAAKTPPPGGAKDTLVGEDLPPPSDEEPEKAAQTEAKEKAKPKGPSEAEELDILMEHMHTLMKGRSYISDSLLREKLGALKFKPANLSKLLDTLVRQARLVRRSGGNYVLGRKAGKK